MRFSAPAAVRASTVPAPFVHTNTSSPNDAASANVPSDASSPAPFAHATAFSFPFVRDPRVEHELADRHAGLAGTLEAREVASGGRVEVLSGLSPGDKVVVGGAALLSDGVKVTPVEEGNGR